MNTTPLGLLSLKEAARHLNISPHTLYTMVSQRRIPFVKIGRLVKFDPAALERWIKEQTILPMPSKHG